MSLAPGRVNGQTTSDENVRNDHQQGWGRCHHGMATERVLVVPRHCWQMRNAEYTGILGNIKNPLTLPLINGSQERNPFFIQVVHIIGLSSHARCLGRVGRA